MAIQLNSLVNMHSAPGIEVCNHAVRSFVHKDNMVKRLRPAGPATDSCWFMPLRLPTGERIIAREAAVLARLSEPRIRED